eukprot:8109340-Pyramimonas_sp.AAC.1
MMLPFAVIVTRCCACVPGWRKRSRGLGPDPPSSGGSTLTTRWGSDDSLAVCLLRFSLGHLHFRTRGTTLRWG